MAMIFTVAPYNPTIDEASVNSMVTLTCSAEGGPSNSFEWTRLSDNSIVDSVQAITLDSSDPSNLGDYQCTITNLAGRTSTTVTLTGETVNT